MPRMESNSDSLHKLRRLAMPSYLEILGILERCMGDEGQEHISKIKLDEMLELGNGHFGPLHKL